MDSYCDINNAYIDKGVLINNFDRASAESTSLEKLARQINSSKRSQAKDVYRQYRRSANTLDRDTQAFNEFLIGQTDKALRPADRKGQVSPHHQRSEISTADVLTHSKLGGFYSAQGDYHENGTERSTKNGSGTLIKDIIKEQKQKKKVKKSDDISLDTPSPQDLESDDSNSSSESSSGSSSSFSSITWDTKEIDKQIKSKSKFDSKKRSKRHKCIDFDLDSVDSLESLDSGESLLRHIRFCRECKNKVIDLIRKNKQSSKLGYNPNTVSTSNLTNIVNELHSISAMDAANKDRTDIFSKYDHIDTNKKSKNISPKETFSSPSKKDTEEGQSSLPEIKEIVTVCLIGFLVVMILDLLMRAK